LGKMTIVSRRQRCSFTPPRSTANMSDLERRELHAVVKGQFGLDEATTDKLVAPPPPSFQQRASRR
jgi:hypothetical protein